LEDATTAAAAAAAAATTSAAAQRRRVRLMRAAAEAAPNKHNRKQTPTAYSNIINAIITCMANCMLTSISRALTLEHWQRKGGRIRVRAAGEACWAQFNVFRLFWFCKKNDTHLFDECRLVTGCSITEKQASAASSSITN